MIPRDFVLGIDFGGTKIALATAALTGEPLRRTRIETRGREGAADVVRRAVAGARELVAATTASTGGSLTSTGVSTFGVVRDGRVLLAPNVPGWENLPLPELLRDELGSPALRVDNDVNAATAAEARWGRLQGVQVGLYVNLGTGLGAGIVAGGQVVSGAHGAAGEIGYALRSPADPGYRDGRAPLEEHVSGSGLARRGSLLLGREISADELFKSRDLPGVSELLDDAVDALALSVANLAIAIDPEKIVLGGGMAAEPSVLPRIRAIVDAAVPFPPEAELARFTDDAALFGALALALDG